MATMVFMIPNGLLVLKVSMMPKVSIVTMVSVALKVLKVSIVPHVL